MFMNMRHSAPPQGLFLGTRDVNRDHEPTPPLPLPTHKLSSTPNMPRESEQMTPKSPSRKKKRRRSKSNASVRSMPSEMVRNTEVVADGGSVKLPKKRPSKSRKEVQRKGKSVSIDEDDMDGFLASVLQDIEIEDDEDPDAEGATTTTTKPDD